MNINNYSQKKKTPKAVQNTAMKFSCGRWKSYAIKPLPKRKNEIRTKCADTLSIIHCSLIECHSVRKSLSIGAMRASFKCGIRHDELMVAGFALQFRMVFYSGGWYPPLLHLRSKQLQKRKRSQPVSSSFFVISYPQYLKSVFRSFPNRGRHR